MILPNRQYPSAERVCCYPFGSKNIMFGLFAILPCGLLDQELEV
jgi:hypothetical protein